MNNAPSRNTKLSVSGGLTFTPVKESLADTYRQQLKIIANGVDVNLNALLNMLSVGQIEELVESHQDVIWQHPEDDGLNGCHLCGLTKGAASGDWWLEFEYVEDGRGAGSFKICDCELSDVLGLMEAIETVLL